MTANYSALYARSQLLSYRKLWKTVQKYLHLLSQPKYQIFSRIIKIDLNYFPGTERWCCEQVRYWTELNFTREENYASNSVILLSNYSKTSCMLLFSKTSIIWDFFRSTWPSFLTNFKSNAIILNSVLWLNLSSSNDGRDTNFSSKLLYI